MRSMTHITRNELNKRQRMIWDAAQIEVLEEVVTTINAHESLGWVFTTLEALKEKGK